MDTNDKNTSKRDALAEEYANKAWSGSWTNDTLKTGFKAGYDAREQEIAELEQHKRTLQDEVLEQKKHADRWYEQYSKTFDQLTAAREEIAELKEIRIKSCMCDKYADQIKELQSQLTAAREEARALREAIQKFSRNYEECDNCKCCEHNSYALDKLEAETIAHAEREEK